ncbi:MAG: hypothetical protein GEU28_05970 [Dehalococcoidia bacterium]|nr:hypothetical protein [Dehalococcoidia bacterium]
MAPFGEKGALLEAASANGPLRGCRVLDVTNRISGSYTGRLLADIGAEVIKVEPTSGDPARKAVVATGPAAGRYSPLFMYCNLNKFGITLNLSTATGRGVLSQLSATADCVILDDHPDHGGLVEDDQLTQTGRAPVLTWITPFGKTGPYAGFSMEELNLYHAGADGYVMPAGLAWELARNREPLRAGHYLASYQAGLTAAVGAAAALFRSMREGLSQTVDVSEQEAQLSLNRSTISKLLQDGVVESRETRAFSFGGVVPCSDGFAEILTLQDREWQALTQALGNPDWIHAPEFSDPLQRGYHGDALNVLLREWSAQFTREELVRLGQQCGLPIAAYYSPAEVLELEHERKRAFFKEFVEDGLTFVYPSLPWRSEIFEWGLRRRAPELGEHNEVIYQRLLDHSPEEVALWRRSSVI